ncbi:MAG TPA: type I-C CRISPR-associated protein Cas8c/Csd1 [Oscillospiraceae bacterium]|nr:type I-C CRISPR-associated protein Cas8c/Csd1 [Oscillospiraceae bacterium]
MILQALTAYYEALAKKDGIARPGWGAAQVAFALELDGEGRLTRVIPLSSPTADGKKLKPQTRKLPAPLKRTVGVASNFLWDNSAYLLGFDSKGRPERAKECFEKARELHLSLLSPLDEPYAKAICRFFERWAPEAAEENGVFADSLTEIKKGANLVFLFDGRFPDEDGALCRAWQSYYDGGSGGETLRCLVTGEKAVPEKIHPAIKKVWGAQSSGAALVSFNADAFCSYGKEQNLNAPASKYAAFAYTTALNALLADGDHVLRFGDTTVVFWAEDAEPAYQSAFAAFLNGGGDAITASELKGCMEALARGEPHDFGGVPLRPKNRFYVLGLAPNAARLSVRFFLRDSFGKFASNLQRHYDDIAVVGDNRSKWDAVPLWALMRETVNQNSRNKSASPQMAGDMLRSILSGSAYPATLYQQTQLRVRAEHEITRGRAGIIKAYLLRLQNNQKYREALTVELNEQTNYQPYVLGRLFSVLEGLQQMANPGINTTIKDKYFTSAGATPSIVFPTLLNLAEKHLRKLDGGKRVYFAKQITELTGRITESYPAHHNLYDQGVFQLGYYHQTQKRFEKKEKTAAAEPMKEEN